MTDPPTLLAGVLDAFDARLAAVPAEGCDAAPPARAGPCATSSPTWSKKRAGRRPSSPASADAIADRLAAGSPGRHRPDPTARPLRA